jgi:transposase InsO family protein
MWRGFLYLVAIMDWYSRKVLAWRLSNSMDADFCVEALKDALAKHGKPEIFNTDKAANLPVVLGSTCSRMQRSRSAWMAKARGVTIA